MKSCTNCGTVVPDEANFCNKCGRSVAGVTLQTQTIIHETSSVPQSHHSSKALVVIILLLLIVGGIGAGAYVMRENKTVLQMLAPFISMNPVESKSSGENSDVVLVADYHKILYEPASDTIPNTVRVQFYGPRQLSGYDLEGNLIVANTVLYPCRDRCSNDTELRLDIQHQPVSGDDNPLVTISLAPIQREFTDFLRSENQSSFLSSIISIKLPTPPPTDAYSKNINGYATYIANVYYDVNRNGKFDPTKDLDVVFADSYVSYVWDTTKVKSTILGWNFELAGKDDSKMIELKGIESYRKSFEHNVMRMPILDSDTQFPLLSEPLPKM